MAMTLTEIQTWLKERSIQLDLADISSVLESINKSPKDLHPQTMPMYLADFEDFATDPNENSSVISKIASNQADVESAALAAPKTVSGIQTRSTNTAKPILRSDRQRVTQAQQEAQQAVNETGLDVHIQQSRQFVNDRIATKEQIREAAVSFVLGQYESLPHEIARDLAKGVKGINYDASTFRGYAEDFDRASGADRLLSELLGESFDSEAD